MPKSVCTRFSDLWSQHDSEVPKGSLPPQVPQPQAKRHPRKRTDLGQFNNAKSAVQLPVAVFF